MIGKFCFFVLTFILHDVSSSHLLIRNAREVDCRCGVSQANRIVGGQNANKNEYPWQILILLNGISWCGGSIIDDRHILTAAHCVQGQDENDFEIVISEHNQFTNDGQVKFEVEKIIIHPDYNSTIDDNDFSILELKEEIDFSGRNYKALPVCLPDNNSNQFVNVSAVATGWGDLTFRGSSPAILQEVTLRTISNSECIRRLSGTSITKNMICAFTPGKDTCQGDSGGPLTTKINNQATLIGVTSFGRGCAGGFPGVYARVSAQLDWIIDNSGGENCA